MATVLTRNRPAPQKGVTSDGSGKDEPLTSTTSLPAELAVGVPVQTKRFFWQTSRSYDPDAIATLPSVFDDPDTAEKYLPRSDWENFHRFDPTARWTWAEENRLIRKIDLKIMLWAIVMFMALEIDRANLPQALTDSFLGDLNLTTDAAQFWLSGRESFLVCRALLGVLQGGFIPDGLFTLIVGLLAFGLMPAGSFQTASWFRGKAGWFDEREQTIIVNRVLREDPSKSNMHNRQPVTPKLLWQSLKDFDLWPLYILGLAFQIPMTPQTQYLTLTLKGLGSDTFQTNLLTIPYYAGHIVSMLIFTYLGEIWNELTFTAMIGQIWSPPFLICLVVLNLATINRWALYAVLVLLLVYPNAHPIQVGWNSRNSNAVRSRTVSAACYNMFVQAGGIISSNIYRADDKPLYKRGNRQLLAVCCMNIVLYFLTKAYCVFRNKQRDKKWDALTEDERLDYLENTTDEGNKRLDFRFQH
ncbi:hypothetical protein LA080_010425 [Diaporthe eres]|nr:hypothetical protein LA080_010425 [Diaporthe eres]